MVLTQTVKHFIHMPIKLDKVLSHMPLIGKRFFLMKYFHLTIHCNLYLLVFLFFFLFFKTISCSLSKIYDIKKNPQRKTVSKEQVSTVDVDSGKNPAACLFIFKRKHIISRVEAGTLKKRNKQVCDCSYKTQILSQEARCC